jgi:multidrug efflux pump subunit AcrB
VAPLSAIGRGRAGEGSPNIQASNAAFNFARAATTIEFNLATNSDRALNDVKDAVTRTRSNLPRNIDGEPLVQRMEVVDLPIVTYAAISPGKTPEQLSWFVDDVVQRKLQGIRGVAAVERIGGVDREILVSLDPDRLQAVGLTAADVSKLLRGTNVDVAGGRAEIGGRDQAIRTLAGAKTLNQLSGFMVGLPMGGAVRLEDADSIRAPDRQIETKGGAVAPSDDVGFRHLQRVHQ